MKKGQYVRCPVILEKNDLEYPRIFVTGQIVAVNEIAETAKIVLHDLYGSKKYYEHIEPTMELSFSRINRCCAMVNAECLTNEGQGIIICKCRNRILDFEYYYARTTPESAAATAAPSLSPHPRRTASGRNTLP